MKLQNQFTNLEQSKRLLELGLPKDSADMYYKHTILAPYIFSDGVLFSVYSKVEDIIPCWSVGRLIEIFEICTPFIFTGFYNYTGTNTEAMIKIYESVICHPVKNLMDFSKLEE